MHVTQPRNLDIHVSFRFLLLCMSFLLCADAALLGTSPPLFTTYGLDEPLSRQHWVRGVTATVHHRLFVAVLVTLTMGVVTLAIALAMVRWRAHRRWRIHSRNSSLPKYLPCGAHCPPQPGRTLMVDLGGESQVHTPCRGRCPSTHRCAAPRSAPRKLLDKSSVDLFALPGRVPTSISVLRCNFWGGVWFQMFRP